jgi:hypothetical protein
MFTVTFAGGTEFVKDGGFLLTGRTFIPQMDRFPILSFGSWTHSYPSLKRRSSVTSNYESTFLS